MPLNLDAIPIVDNHCHSLLREQPADDEAFRIHLTESYFPEIARDHVQHSIFYHLAIRELADFLGCEPRADAVHAARREWGVERLAREVVERGNFKTWLIDSGYGADTTYGLDELRRMVPCDIREILRLEPMIERLIVEAADFDSFLDAYRAALSDLRASGYVGTKSVIAYRSGLQLEAVDRRAAAKAFAPVHAAARRDGRLRIESKPLLDHLIVHRRRGVGPAGGPDPVPHRSRRPRPRPDQGRPGRPPADLLRPLPGRADRAAPHRLPVRPVAGLPGGDVPQRLRRHGRGDPVRRRRGDRDHPRAAGPGAGQQDPVQHGRLARPGALLAGRGSAGGRSAGSSTSTSPTARSTSGRRSTGPSGSCGATRSGSTGSDARSKVLAS